MDSLRGTYHTQNLSNSIAFQNAYLIARPHAKRGNIDVLSVINSQIPSGVNTTILVQYRQRKMGCGLVMLQIEIQKVMK